MPRTSSYRDISPSIAALVGVRLLVWWRRDLTLSPSLPLSLSPVAILAPVRDRFGSGVAVSPRHTAFGSRRAMGSKAQLGDIQRLLQNLRRQLGSDRFGGGRQGKAQDRGAKVGVNWDCPHCTDGIDNFASRTRCFKCGGNRTKNGVAKQANPKQAPRARSRPPKPSDRAPSATPGPKVEAMEVDSTQEDAVKELATARFLYEWARKLPQPSRDELPAARKRLELAEGEDKKRKPPAERLQSALSTTARAKPRQPGTPSARRGKRWRCWKRNASIRMPS